MNGDDNLDSSNVTSDFVDQYTLTMNQNNERFLLNVTRDINRYEAVSNEHDKKQYYDILNMAIPSSDYGMFYPEELHQLCIDKQIEPCVCSICAFERSMESGPAYMKPKFNPDAIENWMYTSELHRLCELNGTNSCMCSNCIVGSNVDKEKFISIAGYRPIDTVSYSYQLHNLCYSMGLISCLCSNCEGSDRDKDMFLAIAGYEPIIHGLSYPFQLHILCLKMGIESCHCSKCDGHIDEFVDSNKSMLENGIMFDLSIEI